MLKELLRLNLQLFAEGGDGGDGGSASATGEVVVDNSGEDKSLAHIPERARKNYQKAMEKHGQATTKPTEQGQATTEPKEKTTERIPYADLIKSDDYKDEHKAYMDKTIGDRLKKFKGIEDELGKHKGLLEIVANKYGISPDDENFLDVLKEKVEEDDSYYEDYAMEHQISTEDARKVISMERKMARMEAEKQEQEKERQRQQHILTLQQNAQKTKAQFPSFDLETEMQDERFRRLCAVNNGDTTAAYMAIHWNEVIPAQVQMASQKIQQQTANAVAANMSRPKENGISSNAPSVVEQDFSKMGLKELRAYAEEQRKRLAGR